MAKKLIDIIKLLMQENKNRRIVDPNMLIAVVYKCNKCKHFFMLDKTVIHQLNKEPLLGTELDRHLVIKGEKNIITINNETDGVKSGGVSITSFNYT